MTNILKKLTAPLILLMIVSCYNDKFDTIDNLSLVEDNNIELKQESNLKSKHFWFGMRNQRLFKK